MEKGKEGTRRSSITGLSSLIAFLRFAHGDVLVSPHLLEEYEKEE